MVARQLYSSPLIGIAEFDHPPHDETWRTVQAVRGQGPLVVFPRVPVVVRRQRDAPMLAGPNFAMLWNAGELYTREPADRRGDCYLELQLRPPTLPYLSGTVDAFKDGAWRHLYAPADRAVYLHQHLLAIHLKTGPIDPLLVEETSVRIVRGVVARLPEASRVRRARTRDDHYALAEAAKRVLALELRERLSLEELGRRLGHSPFHLARVFREETGYSLHAYRLQLRLRTALERLPETVGSLSRLAFELGFASHSHFTTAFQREFGVPPSAVRSRRDARMLLEAARPLSA